MENIVRGDLVWGKWKNDLWWPAIVLNAEDCGRDSVDNNKLWLFWFGDHMINAVICKNIIKFEENFLSRFNGKGRKKYLQAIEEALIVCADRYEVNYGNPSSLFQWASDGFQSSVKRNRQIFDLPEVVRKSLNRDAFKRRLLSDGDGDSDSDNESETQIKSLVLSVSEGSKNLDNICISCCKSSASVVAQHPIFLGGICLICKKNIDRISSLPPGKIWDMCILCGQGGTLLICSNVMCLRSFCQLCIQYLAPEGSLSKILKNKDWFCYVCKSDNSKNCLIKVRNKLGARKPVAIPVPREKNPIQVIAHSNLIHSVLENKRIIIGKYCTFDASNFVINFDNLKMEYKDMSQKKFTEISADLVCGAYIVPYDPSQCRKKCVDSFFVDFYGYLFCLSNAKIAKSSVFFLYAATEEMFDDLMYSRILRFLEVEPITVKCEKRIISVWTNISDYSSICSRMLSLKKKTVQDTVEECLFSHFLEPLKRYFFQLPEVINNKCQ